MLLRHEAIVFKLAGNTAVKGKVLEGNARIHAADKICRGKLVIFVAYKRISNLIVVFKVFPKVKTLF